MRKLLAVSGGVDSVALLHFYRNDPAVIVAHFHHGTRPSATDDQVFVKRLAAQYGKPFFTERQPLGPHVAEETARTARYQFLTQLAVAQHAQIYTAHHLDDLIESIAINLQRGTGWRGLVPLDRYACQRPFIAMGWGKQDILRYAAQHQLVFRQDPTNAEDQYLRNRLRSFFTANLSFAQRQRLVQLYLSQKQLKTEIHHLLATLLPSDHVYLRSWFQDLPTGYDAVALEFLKYALSRKGISATTPQLQSFLHAIQTYAPEKSFNLPHDHLVKLHKTYFML